MPTVDRMFRVIVAGGIALSATAPGLVAGCGGSVATMTSDGGPDSFPVEGPPSLPDAFPQETAQQVDAFPQEGPPVFEAGSDAGVDARLGDAGGDQDAFPHEGPNLEAGFFDTSHPEASSDADAAAGPDGFPQETAAP